MVKHLPNAITAMRLVLLPVAAWALLRGDRPLTLGLVAAIAVSDWLDGYLARRFALVTPLGAILDPLADKLTQLTLLVLLAWGGQTAFATIPRWFVALVLAREVFLVYGAVRVRMRVGGVTIRARWEGKLSTALV
ncbi:MAG: CDP-alcohol phosphatidyltransferase family protein, partial [Planctomycetota bacterium]